MQLRLRNGLSALNEEIKLLHSSAVHRLERQKHIERLMVARFIVLLIVHITCTATSAAWRHMTYGAACAMVRYVLWPPNAS